MYGCDDERKASIPRSNGNCREWSGWSRSRRSGERLGASGRELHVSPALVQPQPTALDRELQPGAIFGRTAAARGEKGPVWRRPSCTGSTELAISISLRAAASGSAKARGATNFMRLHPQDNIRGRTITRKASHTRESPIHRLSRFIAMHAPAVPGDSLM